MKGRRAGDHPAGSLSLIALILKNVRLAAAPAIVQTCGDRMLDEYATKVKGSTTIFAKMTSSEATVTTTYLRKRLLLFLHRKFVERITHPRRMIFLAASC